jgi:3-oxoacyl-[acyl-carrier protein] reductase
MNRLASTSALRRPQSPENIADAILFLASDGASEITGQCINVDSGIIRR